MAIEKALQKPKIGVVVMIVVIAVLVFVKISQNNFGEPPITDFCGDGVCGETENCAVCPEDCPCDITELCGNGVCDDIESHLICPQDCPAPGDIMSLSVKDPLNNTNIESDSVFQITLNLTCLDICNALFIKVYDSDDDAVGEHDEVMQWTNKILKFNVSTIGKEQASEINYYIYADTESRGNVLIEGTPDAYAEAVYVIKSDFVDFNQTFELAEGETVELTNNYTIEIIRIDSETGETRIAVETPSGVKTSTLYTLEGQKNLFYDSFYLTFNMIKYIEFSEQYVVSLTGSEKGLISRAVIMDPLESIINHYPKFKVYVECRGICNGTYVGIHIQNGSEFNQIGEHVNTTDWSGFIRFNISLSINSYYNNETWRFILVADSENVTNVREGGLHPFADYNSSALIPVLPAP